MDARARARAVLECIERSDGTTTTTTTTGGGGDATAVGSPGRGNKRRRGAAAVELDPEGGDGKDEDGGGKRVKGAGAESGGAADGSSGLSGTRGGIREDELAEKLGGVMSVDERAQAINELLYQRKIAIFKRGDSLVFERVHEEQAAKFKGLSTEDMLIYQIIQHAGNAGMWTKELKQRSNLPVPQITKCFRTLEARKLIKSVKNVAQSNRKVYMLYDLEPSREITGGAWYTEQEFDTEFINILCEQCVNFIYSKDRVTLEEVSEFIISSKLSHIVLSTDDVLQIVNTLVYDGKVDVTEDESHDDGMGAADEDFKPIKYYSKALIPIPEGNAYTNIPCGVCPVINECRPDGLINPTTCEYMTAWLEY
jgi:DNA-directed RNA polymerase III subunit RPC6